MIIPKLILNAWFTGYQAIEISSVQPAKMGNSIASH